MNNYIDERIIPNIRTQSAVHKNIHAVKGRPLTRRRRNEGILMKSLRGLAVIFLLPVSTFGGEKKKEVRMSEAVTALFVYGLLFGGILLALWGILFVLNGIINFASGLPMGGLILVFAVVLLVAAGAMKK